MSVDGSCRFIRLFALASFFLAPAAIAQEEPSATAVTRLPDGTVSSRYGTFLPIRGGEGSLTWKGLGSLPPGLQLEKGWLYGVPTEGGEYQFSIQVSDQANTRLVHPFAIHINPLPPPPPPALRMISRNLPDAVVGVGYHQPFQAEGGHPPYEWTVESGLPGWARVDGGTISGMPDAAMGGPSQLAVSVKDSQGATVRPVVVSLNVVPNPLAGPLSMEGLDTLPPAMVGVDYRFKLTARGGQPPYRFVQTGLPAGIQVDPDGTVHGRAQTTGPQRIAVTLSDAVGQQVQQVFSIEAIAPGASDLQIGQLPNMVAQVGEMLRIRVPVIGGIAPYRFELDVNSAGWLKIESPAGVMAGIPDRPGAWPVRVSVADQIGQRLQVPDFTIEVHGESLVSMRWREVAFWTAPVSVLVSLVLAFLLYRAKRSSRHRQDEEGDPEGGDEPRKAGSAK